jgi:hypothetical protein
MDGVISFAQAGNGRDLDHTLKHCDQLEVRV